MGFLVKEIGDFTRALALYKINETEAIRWIETLYG
jgi:hypothetical protein